MNRTGPVGFSLLVSMFSKRWIQAVQVPVCVAKVTVDNLATSHGRQPTLRAQNDVLLGIFKLEVIRDFLVATTSPECWLGSCRHGEKDAWLTLSWE